MYILKTLAEKVTFRGLLISTSSPNCHLRLLKLRHSQRLRKMSGDSSESSWRGVPITQIYGAQTPWGAPEFPLIRPSSNHTVLYHIPDDGVITDWPPKPQIGKDSWDQYHVRLPCSSQNLYPVTDESGETQLKKRWGMIERALSKPIRNIRELADAILSYNTQFKDKWRFPVLHKLFNKYLEKEETKYFFDVTLPDMVKLALDLPKLIQAPIPLLKQHKNHSISLTQQQIACLLANAFFCTYPRRNSIKWDSEYATYPCINFSRLYESSASRCVLEKMKCICHYFRRVCSKVPTGVVTFCRRSVPPMKCPDWSQSTKSISTLPVHTDSEVFIERADGLIQVDFANRYLGGGVLGHGCVQEEIRFVICPELIASMLFCEEMRPNEAVLIIGVEQYSEYTGYGNEFEWVGSHREGAPADGSARRRCAVLALDALRAARRPHEQFERDGLLRELNKAWVGFSFFTGDQQGLSYPGVATGNWGCGVYRGSPHLKSLLQLMACAQAGRPMAYYTFKDTALRNDIINVYNLLSRYNVTVGQLYNLLVLYGESTRSVDLFTYLTKTLQEETIESVVDSERMDISDTSDVLAVSTTVERNLDNLSPELFSQDDLSGESLQPTQMLYPTSTQTSQSYSQTIEKEASAESDEEGNKLTNDGNTVSDLNKTDVHTSVNMSQTSRLFDEMGKLDGNSGKLNFNSPNTSFADMNTSLNSSFSADSERTIQIDLSTETKKKLTGKITDYFSKKRT